MQAVDRTLSRGESPFGQLLREFRMNANLSQEMLAERARLSVAGISVLERGVRRAPHRETVALLGSALELSPNDLARLEAAAVRTPVLRPLKREPIDSQQSPVLRLLDNQPPRRYETGGSNPAAQIEPSAELIATTLAAAFHEHDSVPSPAPAAPNVERRLLQVLLAFEHALQTASLMTQQLVELHRNEPIRARSREGQEPGTPRR